MNMPSLWGMSGGREKALVPRLFRRAEAFFCLSSARDIGLADGWARATFFVVEGTTRTRKSGRTLRTK